MQQFIFNTAQTNASQSSLMYPCSTIWEWACTLFALPRFAWARVSWCYMPNVRFRIAFCNWQNMTSTVLDLSVIKNNMVILHYISLYCQGHMCIIHWNTLWEGQCFFSWGCLHVRSSMTAETCNLVLVEVDLWNNLKPVKCYSSLRKTLICVFNRFII